MNPNNGSELQPMQLPSPVEQNITQGNPTESMPQRPEKAPMPEQSPGLSQPMPLSTTIPLPVTPTLPTSVASVSDLTSSQTNPLQASDDKDIIEKEWVNKAKQIIEGTRDNPYKQSEELTVFKADYMKKRYNRIIKVK